MKIIVGQHKLEIVKEPVNEREIDISKCEFEFDEAITSEYVKEAYFTLESNTYKQIILNDECDIPSEVLVKKGTVEIGVVAFLVENEEEIKRYNPSPAYFNTWVGSLKDNAENSEPVTPTDKEQMEQALQDGLNSIDDKLGEVDDKMLVVDGKIEDIDTAITQTNNLNIDVSDKVGKDVTVTLTKKDATTKVVTLSDGTSLMFNWSGTSLGIKTDEDEEYTYVDLQGIQGPVGPMGAPFTIKKTYATIQLMIADYDNMNVGDYVMIDGNIEQQDNATLWVKEETEDPTYKWHYLADFSGATGIQGPTGLTPNIQIGTVVSGATPSVTRTGTNENPVLNFTLVKGDKGDTGNTGATGNGISSVAKTGTSGLVDTYTITYTNGNTSTFTVTNGNGIASIAKTSSAGLIDTYTITFTDGTTTTFNITNGADGDVTQEYVDEENERLKSLYNVLPKVSGTGESVTLNNTGDTMLYKMDLKGNTSQEVISGEVGLEVNDTSIYVDDVNTTKENYINLKGNTYQETTSISGGDQYDSPSPDYPQEVEVVTGLNEVVVNGKNLFDKDKTPDNYFYNSTGTTTTDTSNNYVNQTYENLSENVYISFTSKTGSPNVRICEYNSSNAFIKRTLVTSNQMITLDSSTTKVIFSVDVGATNYFTDLQIEQGSTATTYEAYKGQTYEVNLGSIELCKIGTYQDRIYKSNIDNNWYVHKEIGKVVLNGSENWDLSTLGFILGSGEVYKHFKHRNINIFDGFCNYFAVEKSSTTWVKIDYCGWNIQGVFWIRDDHKLASTANEFKTWLSTHNTTVYYVLATATETQITDTTLVNQLEALYTANIHSITHINTETSNLLPYIDLKYNVVTASPSPERASEVEVVKGNNTITISNENGTKTQTYNLTLGNLELCKIGDYQDYFYKDNGNWYKYAMIGKLTLNGTENWGVNQYAYVIDNIINAKPFSSIANVMAYSNYFLWGNGDVSSNAISFWYNFAGTGLRFIDGNSNLSNFKNWLSTHNTTVYYVLATPTQTQITDQLLVSQLDELQKAMSYYDKTLITQVNDDKPFILDVIGIRDLQDIFNL